MARTIYWLCFSLVFISILLGTPRWFSYLFGFGVPFYSDYSYILSFGTIVPPMLSSLFPHFVQIALGILMMYLLLRRLWLLFTKKESFPPSFNGISKKLGCIGAVSFLLSGVTLGLTIASSAGSGVPAALLALPAVICIPWAIFLTEVRSIQLSASAGSRPLDTPDTP